MKKNFKSVKASLIMGILLVSVFAAMTPQTSAAGFSLGLSQAVQLNWESGNQSLPIVPSQELRSYNLELTYMVTKGGLFGSLAYALLIGRSVDIKLEIVGSPEWCTATLQQGSIRVSVPSTIGKPADPVTMPIQISVKNDAPAFVDGQINIRVTIPQVSVIPSYDNTVTLRLKASYLGKLSPVAEKQSVILGPMDQTSVPIQVTNQGNAQTFAKFRIIGNIPEGWTVLVTDHIILDPKETGTVYFTAIPPKGFGYHDDQTTFTIEYTPLYNDDQSIGGEPQYITIAVQSRGFSVIGIEVILLIIILIAVVLFVAYMLIKRMPRK